MIRLFTFVAVVLVSSLFVSCTESPRRQLTSVERAADVAWIFSKFDHNYAPVSYKEQLHSFDYETLKTEFMAEAQKDQTNEEFYRLIRRFVAQFQDAHTSGWLTVSPLPGRARIAYLGFKGVRQGQSLVVTELLPTIKDPNFPIKVGDVISALDGVPLTDLIDRDLVPYLNLGNKQANYTVLMNSLFTRGLNTFPAPGKSWVKLSVTGLLGQVDVELPWIVKDLAKFKEEQLSAIQAASSEPEKDLESLLMLYAPFIANTSVLSYSKLIDIFVDEKEGDFLSRILEYNSQVSHFDSFEFFPHHDIWTKLDAVQRFYKVEEPTTVPKGPQAFTSYVPGRQFSVKSYRVPGSEIFPAVVLISGEGKESVGYVQIGSFSVPESSIQEFKNTLQYFYDIGIKRLMIDTINNGGGSLLWGSVLAQALSPYERINLPAIRVRLNDNWVDSFEASYLVGASDAEKETSGRIFRELLEGLDKGEILSPAYNVRSLFPFVAEPSRDFLSGSEGGRPFKVVVLVNELCASMCDIFAAILQDNGMAKVFGQQTMGAGGNVTNHMQAPNSGLLLSQTESLLIRSNGEYLENRGVVPDRVYNTFEDISGEFSNTISVALEYLLQLP